MESVVIHAVEPRFESLEKQIKFLQKQLADIIIVLKDMTEQQKIIKSQIINISGNIDYKN